MKTMLTMIALMAAAQTPTQLASLDRKAVQLPYGFRQLKVAPSRLETLRRTVNALEPTPRQRSIRGPSGM
jgi:hypothetical protein